MIFEHRKSDGTMNTDAFRAAILEGLPLRMRWMIGDMSWAWDFSRARQELRPLNDADVVGMTVPPEWSDYLIFGEQDFSDGGGASPYVVVHAGSGKIHWLDVESEASPISLFNSSLSHFVETFRLFELTLRQQAIYVWELQRQASLIDPESFGASEWRLAVETMIEELKSNT